MATQLVATILRRVEAAVRPAPAGIHICSEAPRCAAADGPKCNQDCPERRAYAKIKNR